eukprot:4867987-Prymnesium_polylepis.1
MGVMSPYPVVVIVVVVQYMERSHHVLEPPGSAPPESIALRLAPGGNDVSGFTPESRTRRTSVQDHSSSRGCEPMRYHVHASQWPTATSCARGGEANARECGRQIGDRRGQVGQVEHTWRARGGQYTHTTALSLHQGAAQHDAEDVPRKDEGRLQPPQRLHGVGHAKEPVEAQRTEELHIGRGCEPNQIERQQRDDGDEPLPSLHAAQESARGAHGECGAAR